MSPSSKIINHTASDHVEQALIESQARLAGIIASAMDAIITIDDQQRILLFNASAEKMFDYQASAVMGEQLDILIPPRFRANHRKHIDRFGQTGTTNRAMGNLGRLYGLRSNGEEFPIEASISQVTTASGKLYSVILRDITERVRVEEQLIENEQNLLATFEQAAVGIAHVAPDGRFLRVNKRICDITGMSEEELLNKTYREITDPRDLEYDVEMHEKALRGDVQSYTLEKRYIRKDGSPIWVNLTASVVRNLSGTPKYLVKILEDITRRKADEAALQTKTEELRTMTQQLWQTARLATMGELAASIAHELNNPLAIISLRIESLLAGIEPGSPDRRELEVIEQEVDRMASLVTNLLQFTRSKDRQVSTLDLREEVDKTLELMHTHMIHRHIEVVREYSADLPMLLADRQQLRQLFLNLFTNSSDAMPKGGVLGICLKKDDGKGIVHVQVKDTGEGIKPENLRYVMDPFFTTKEEGKGTGLGLSICRRIVDEHKGTIQISSPGENKGTQIDIFLPVGSEAGPSLILED